MLDRRAGHRGRGLGPLLALALVWGAWGCAKPPRFTEDVSYDGLVRVENTGFDLAWVRPAIDVARYRKVILQDAGIEYRPVRPGASRDVSAGDLDFPLTERQKDRLREITERAFLEELSKSERFDLVGERGRDVLLLRAALLDVVSHVPPERAGRGEVLLRSVGEATLVLELRDSQSEAILARAVDRRAAERMGGMMMESTPAINAMDVDRAARGWASLVRRRLEQLLREGGPVDVN